VRKRLLSTATAAVLGATSLVAAPLQAHAALEDCQVGQLCLFDTETGEGIFVDTADPLWNANLHDDDNFGDRASAIVNRSGRSVCLYLNVDFGGNQALYIPDNISGSLQGDWNNTVSSYRFPGVSLPC
jgi:hypothetical protein